jgi:hypothetical protein
MNLSYLGNLLHLTVLLNPRFWLGNLKCLYQRWDHQDEIELLSGHYHLNLGQQPRWCNINHNEKLNVTATPQFKWTYNNSTITRPWNYLCQQTPTSDVRESPVLICRCWKNIIPCWMKWQTCNWTFMCSKHLSCLWCWNIPYPNGCIRRCCYHQVLLKENRTIYKRWLTIRQIFLIHIFLIYSFLWNSLLVMQINLFHYWQRSTQM